MRLFVAVWPPADVLDAVAALDRPAQAGVGWTTREQWHVTLRFLGRIDDVDSVTGRLASVTSRLGSMTGQSASVTGQSAGAVDPLSGLEAGAGGEAGAGSGSGSGFTAVGGPVTARLGPSILVLPVNGLDRLAAAVVGLTASMGEPPADRPFAGHLTLARARRGVAIGGGLAGAPLSARWPVSEVTLVASELNPAGARYSIVARFGLAEPVPAREGAVRSSDTGLI